MEVTLDHVYLLFDDVISELSEKLMDVGITEEDEEVLREVAVRLSDLIGDGKASSTHEQSVRLGSNMGPEYGKGC